MKRWVIAASVLVAACGTSPSAPSATVIPNTPTSTISGTITATNGGQPIAGASISIGFPSPSLGVTTTTDSAGHYTLSVSAVFAQSEYLIQGTGLIQHF